MEAEKQNRTVLLVEDSDDDAFFFERAFITAGVNAKLLRFIDGKDAVTYLEQTAATGAAPSEDHVMFLDLKLPVMSGFDVLQWIRSRGLLLEVIVLSGSDLESDMAAARRLGAADYLVKPVSFKEIRRRLGRVPNGHER